jgi:hypothetical protein
MPRHGSRFRTSLRGLIMPEPTSGRRSRLTEPSTAAGLAALHALIVLSVADQAPALVDLGLTAVQRSPASQRSFSGKVPAAERGAGSGASDRERGSRASAPRQALPPAA